MERFICLSSKQLETLKSCLIDVFATRLGLLRLGTSANVASMNRAPAEYTKGTGSSHDQWDTVGRRKSC